MNPWVRGDGVAYYAYVRSLLIDGDLRFENEWLAANQTFVEHVANSSGKLLPQNYTRTGYIANPASVGPSILWAPFLVVTHLGVLTLDVFGAKIPADGYSPPYLVTMALATAFYGFLGLLLAFRLAREYLAEQWAFLATLGIWFASSLPVYMYLNPSWSHAHSAFVVALFLWYWHRTRSGRTPLQWMGLGLLAGLMLDVYYPNGIVLLAPLIESLLSYTRALRGSPRNWAVVSKLFAANVLFLVLAVFAFLPTLITRRILHGGMFAMGYYSPVQWNWTSPALWSVLFSSNHGLFSWTPILLLAVLGCFALVRRDRFLGMCVTAIFLAYYYLIASYPTWDGISSFGNRFFVSLTPVFVLGLSAALSAFGGWFRSRRAAIAVCSVLLGLISLWNIGFMLQWGLHLIPSRGPISWRQMFYNQTVVVPARVAETVRQYVFHRQQLMKHVEEVDQEQLRAPGEAGR